MILLTDASRRAIEQNLPRLSPALLEDTWRDIQTRQVTDFLQILPVKELTFMETTTFYYFDVLPIHPQPEWLESFTSYLARLAAANHIRTRHRLFSICFPDRHTSHAWTWTDHLPISSGLLPIVASFPPCPCCRRPPFSIWQESLRAPPYPAYSVNF